jgi:hypothetical protein
MDLTPNRQLALPGDPTGIPEAHDILAAEDFAMPSGPDRLAEKLRGGGTRGPIAVLAAAALAAVVYAAVKRR